MALFQQCDIKFTRQESKIVIDGYTEGNEGFRKMVDDVVANEPTFSGTSVLNNRLMQLYVFLVFSIIILEVLVLFLLNYNLIKFIHNTKSMVTNTTFKMQITLFKAVSIETGFLLFFLKAPYVLAVVCSINLFGIFGSTYLYRNHVYCEAISRNDKKLVEITVRNERVGVSNIESKSINGFKSLDMWGSTTKPQLAQISRNR
uniref:Uncharacterized protein n=1 Tax=Acrobeloides nanus TaxID=290746 RepID=A0A914CB68_9BILA